MDLGNFFVVKPTVWLYGQLYGSKSKKVFEATIAPIIEAEITKSGIISVADKWIQSNLSTWVQSLIKEAGIPVMWKSLAQNWVLAEISALFK